jgi:hypothetical protein
MTRLLLGLVLVAPSLASAQACDELVGQASTAQGPALVTAFQGLISCDAKVAESAFDAFMKASGDVDTLVEMSLHAIDAKIYTPVWTMMEKIPDYSARDSIAEGVGVKCGEHPQVLTFLQGAYFGLRDIQFNQWDDALETCDAAPLTVWMEGIVAKPPTSSYDEKYNTIINAFVKRKRAEALPILERAAVDAANTGGPFSMIIEKMDQAVEPEEMGERMSDEARQGLEASLVDVANAVGPEQAALVADRLYNSGSETAAASLLPRVYPDRVQADGKLLYGAAAVEICEKEAVIHWASVTEPSHRWSIVADIEAPARAFKPKLDCAPSEPWAVVATGEPVASAVDIQVWADDLVQQWVVKGFATTDKSEKPIALP